MRFFNCRALLILLLLPMLAQASPDQVWPEKCTELKQKYLTDPILQITFEKKPSVQAKAASWTLNWQGLPLAVPDTGYDLVAVNRDAEGNYFVHLRDRRTKVSLTLLQHPPMNETLQTGNRKMSQYELTMLGYEKTPADLGCQPGSWAKEAPIADALILKGIDVHGKLAAVYREAGKHPGWTLKIVDGNEVSFRSFRQLQKNKRMLEITLSTPQDNAFRILGYQIGKPAEDKAGKKPGWLTALEKALNSSARADWQAFFQLAEQQGFDKQQLANSRKNLE